MTPYIDGMKSLIRSMILAVALSAPLIFPVYALADPPETAPVTALDAALIATMKAGAAGSGFTARYKALEPVIRHNFDLSVIGQNSVGFLWATLSAAQQQQVSALFEQFTVASYVSQFSGYAGQTFVVLPTEKSLGAKKIIQTQLTSSDGSAPVELDYVVAAEADGWRITDILLNGTISQVAVHASDFSGLVSSGDASQLISALKEKIATLSGGATAPADSQ